MAFYREIEELLYWFCAWSLSRDPQDWQVKKELCWKIAKQEKKKKKGAAKMDAGTINFIFAVPEGMSRPSIPLFYKGFGWFIGTMRKN
jgi:hypothetical protein